MSTNSGMPDIEFLALENVARKSVMRPYKDGTPESDQDLAVWIGYHRECDRVARRAVAAAVWDESRAATRDDYGTRRYTSNPYRASP